MSQKVLVVDDEPQMRSRIQQTLEPRGYQVTLATCGEEGLQGVAVDQPDLVILDGGLSDMSHHEFMKRLGGSSNGDRPRVLVLTAPWDHGGLHEPNTGADLYNPQGEIVHSPHWLLPLVKRLLNFPPRQIVHELA